MKKLNEMYGIPVTIFCLIVGVVLIVLNPAVNSNGGFDLPDWLQTVCSVVGIIFLLLFVYFAINTFKKKNR